MKLTATIKMYHRWWKAWGTLPVHAWVKAATLYRSGRFAEAVKLYQAGLKESANHPAALSAHLDLAYCLFRSGDAQRAHAELKDILLRAPECREAYLRLANLQLWIGQELEAAWTIHRALRQISVDGELAGTFLLALVQHGGPDYLLKEALRHSENCLAQGDTNTRLRVARALYSHRYEDSSSALVDLETLATENEASREAVLVYAEIAIEEGKIAQARLHLRRLLNGSSEHPRVLSLLATSYLKSGAFYNADYAVQLATTACQRSGWSSPREMHILAESFYHIGDKNGALLVASKAKDAGSRLLGSYPEEHDLAQLIEQLSMGTQI